MRRLAVLVLVGVVAAVLAACGPSTDSEAGSLDSNAHDACDALSSFRAEHAGTGAGPSAVSTRITQMLARSDTPGAKATARSLTRAPSTRVGDALRDAQRWCRSRGFVGFDASWQAACRFWASEVAGSQIFDFSSDAVSSIVDSLNASKSTEAHGWATKIDGASSTAQLGVINSFGNDCARRENGGT